TGGWLGWLGYDVAWEIEHLSTTHADALPFPVAYWYVPDCFAVLDHWDQTLWLAATDASDLDRMDAVLVNAQVRTQGRVMGKGDRLYTDDQNPRVPIHFVSDQSSYEAAVMQAKKYIRAGDIFQANLSLRFSSPTQADSWSIYTALQRLNPSPFASYWHTPWGAVISCSPERLVQRRGNLAQTRPIAGTRPRGKTPAHDQGLEKELLDNRKENAEHIMLVDLERNDLGRVCEWGSVSVDELLTIERYSHVMHLVSNVMGTVRSPNTSIDLIRALFPGGTITGCPKVRCMDIIEELEPVRRNLFYGSCGYLDWRGDLDLNILIRTLLYVPDSHELSTKTTPLRNTSIRTHTVWGQIGAGIVADSEPEREWHEALSKAQAQLTALASSIRLIAN
ncbi:MAG: anthranilate synthase component I, partial [Cyanobacteria bacterium P01_A01_bin.37]